MNYLYSDIELELLEEDINLYCQAQLLAIREDVEFILMNAIQSRVYDYYEPTWYERTYELLHAVRSDIRMMNGTYTLHVYVDTDMLNYVSVYNTRNVSSSVPYWVDKGHESRNLMKNNGNQFHDYEGRSFLQEAYEELILKYSDEGVLIMLDSQIPSYQ